MQSSHASSSKRRVPSLRSRQKTRDLYPEETSLPLLNSPTEERDRRLGRRESDSNSEEEYRPVVVKPEMKWYDNLRGWDRPKVYRYVILLALSLSGDGW